MEDPQVPLCMPLDPAYETGHPDIDARFRDLLACCARLGAHASGAGLEEALAAFKAQVRDLFRAVEERLRDADDKWRVAQRAEQEEFECFADEVITGAHFDAVELQRFATLWSIGHLHGAAARLRHG